MKAKIESITNIAILVFLLVVGGVYVKNNFFSSHPTLIRAGDRAPALAGYDWASHPRTLVLALRHGCHYCEESAPFYKRLVDLEQSGRLGGIHIVAVFPDDKTTVEKSLQDEGWSVDYRPAIPLQNFKVAGTPTLVLVDGNSKVLSVWLGKLRPDEEGRVINSLTNTQTASSQ